MDATREENENFFLFCQGKNVNVTDAVERRTKEKRKWPWTSTSTSAATSYLFFSHLDFLCLLLFLVPFRSLTRDHRFEVADGTVAIDLQSIHLDQKQKSGNRSPRKDEHSAKKEVSAISLRNSPTEFLCLFIVALSTSADCVSFSSDTDSDSCGFVTLADAFTRRTVQGPSDGDATRDLLITNSTSGTSSKLPANKNNRCSHLCIFLACPVLIFWASSTLFRRILSR